MAAHRYTIYLFIGTRWLALDPKGNPSLHQLSVHRGTLAGVGIQETTHRYTIYLFIGTRWLA